MKLYEEQNKRKTEVFIDKLFCMMNEDVVDRAAFAIYEFFIVPAAEESDEKKDEVVLKMLAYFFYKLMEDEFPMTTVFYPINKIAEIINSFTVCPSCYEELKQYDICQPNKKIIVDKCFLR